MPATQTLSIETITPARAKLWLEANIGNRPLRNGRVDQYAAMMVKGEWLLTGEPIIFNGSSLVNGQHRLQACVVAGVPFTTAVFRGAAPDVFAVVDSGLIRRPGDILQQHEHANFNIVAAAARLVITFESGTMVDPKRASEIATRTTTLREADDWRDRYRYAAQTGANARKDGFNPSSITAFLVLLGRHAGDEVADEWVETMLSGIGLEAGDPRLAMRKWVISAKANNIVHLSSLIRARNAFIKNESRTSIRPWFRGTPFPTFDEPASRF